MAGFNGNLLAGLVTSLLVFFLALHFGKEADGIIKEQKRIQDEERDIKRFERFLKEEAFHCVRFPDLKNDTHVLGLEYEIKPCRDQTTNEPIEATSETHRYYLIQVLNIAYKDVQSHEQLIGYEHSPIKEGEYYYCQYFNDDWHMSQDGPGDKWHRFYLSSKVGPVEYGQRANEFMKQSADPTNMTLVSTLHLKDDGTLLKGVGGCTVYKIFEDKNKHYWLKIHDAPLKKVYFRNTEESQNDYFLEIEKMGGYGDRCYFENLKLAIVESTKSLQNPIRKIQWYNLG